MDMFTCLLLSVPDGFLLLQEYFYQSTLYNTPYSIYNAYKYNGMQAWQSHSLTLSHPGFYTEGCCMMSESFEGVNTEYIGFLSQCMFVYTCIGIEVYREKEQEGLS